MNNSIYSASKFHLNSIQTLNCRNTKAILAISEHLHTVVATTPFDDKTYKRVSKLYRKGLDDEAHEAYRKVKFKNKQGWNREPDSAKDIREGVKKNCLGIYCPGSPASSTKNIVVIDIDSGGKRALKRIHKLLGLNDSNSVVTLSGKRGRFHVWVYVKDALKVVGKKIPWEAERGSGEVLHDHGVVAWNPSADLLKFLKRVRKGKVPAVDVQPLVGKSKRKKIQPADCSRKISKQIEKLLKPISKLIRPKVQKAYLMMGAAPESERNNTLNTLAMGLGAQYANQPGWKDIQKGLAKVAYLKGLDAGEIDSTIRSGWTAGENVGAEEKASGKRVRVLDKILTTKVEKLSQEDMVHMLLGEVQGRFIQYGEKAQKKWLEFEPDSHWVTDNAESNLQVLVEDRVKEEKDAGRLPTLFDADRVMNRLQHRLKFPRGKTWDGNPLLRGLPDGKVWDIKAGLMRDGRPDDYITQTMNVIPRKGTKKELKALKKFMFRFARMYPKDERDLVYAWMQAFRGSCYLLETNTYQTILILYGKGDTGKSTWINTLSDILGPHFSAVLNGDDLNSKGFAHSEYIYKTKGKSMVSNADIEWQDIKRDLLKQMSAGDMLTGRAMRENSEMFKSVASLVFGSNDIPQLQGDVGLMKRFLLLHTMPIPEEQKDPEFIDFITSDKMLEVIAYEDLVSAKKLLNDKLLVKAPECIKLESDRLFGENDTFTTWWVAKRLEPCPGHFEPVNKLLDAFDYDMKKTRRHEKFNLRRVRMSCDTLGFPPQEVDKRGYPKQKKVGQLICSGIWHAKIVPIKKENNYNDEY